MVTRRLIPDDDSGEKLSLEVTLINNGTPFFNFTAEGRRLFEFWVFISRSHLSPADDRVAGWSFGPHPQIGQRFLKATLILVVINYRSGLSIPRNRGRCARRKKMRMDRNYTTLSSHFDVCKINGLLMVLNFNPFVAFVHNKMPRKDHGRL